MRGGEAGEEEEREREEETEEGGGEDLEWLPDSGGAGPAHAFFGICLC